MPALINNRLAAAFEAIPDEARHAPEFALAAYGVMEGAALALGMPSTGVSFFKPGALAGAPRFAYVVSWPDGPDGWATPAAVANDGGPYVLLVPNDAGNALYFEGRVA